MLLTSLYRIASYLLIYLIFLPVVGYGSEPPTQPLLRIDGHMHAKPILRIGSDRGNHFFVSVSADKTLRIWQLPSGRLRKTIRVPIAAGSEGELSAVAVSPEGEMIAASGSTGKTWARDQGYFIYLFDTATGKMRRRIGGLPELASHLAISDDGKYLAVVMAGKAGLRVYQINDGRLLRSDNKYGDGCTWVDFNKHGHLVTSSLDGFIRRYDDRFLLIQKKKISKDYQPHSAVFSPDGEKIAVGFRNRAVVTVFSAKDLSVLFFPDASAAVGDFRTVAWSVDGNSLYGAGDHRNNRRHLIRWWKNGGKPHSSGWGEYVDLPTSNSALSHILTLQDGGIVYSGLEPVLGALDAQGFLLFRRSRPTFDFASWQKDLRISTDGSRINFPVSRLGKKIGRFSAREVAMAIKRSGQSKLLPPLIRSQAISVTGWDRQSAQLKLNGHPLPLPDGETANGLAIARNGRFFMVGTTSHLRQYDQFGRAKLVIPISSPVRGLNISLDGKVIVAAHEDGIVRWYRSQRGTHFLSLFPHRDRKRWIAWTPNKFFAASAGGDQIMGWHKNQGHDHAAKFIPAAKLRKSNANPDQIRGLFR
jgi:WD40 repeat protein